MKDQRIPLLLLGQRAIARMGHRSSIPGRMLQPLFPRLGKTLSEIRFEVEPDAYLTASLLSSFVYGLLLFGLMFTVISVTGTQEDPLPMSLGIGLVFWMTFFMLHVAYPGIIVRKIAAKENKDLLFALREIIIDVDGGVPLFDSMRNISQSEYGYISLDFDWAVRRIESGMPEREALKQLALKTESEFLKRAAWQMVNALESGARMGDALESIAASVENYLFHEIRDYSSNLNFLLLLYMLGGIVAPSLGITFMILLPAFSGLGVTLESVFALISATAVLQIAMIGYMSSTRPGLFGG